MKLTGVELHPGGNSAPIVLSFRDPRRQNPYNVKAIVGLDVDSITPLYYRGASLAEYYDLSMEPRDIVVRVELNPRFGQDETYSELRDSFYRAIATSRTGIVEMRFKNNLETVAVIFGHVSKLEAPHFSNNPEVQLTLKCDDPVLRAPNPVSIDLTGMTPGNTTLVDELSTAPHGFTFELAISTARSEIEIVEPANPEASFVVNFGFNPGDILYFSSVKDNKYLYMYWATMGLEYPIANFIEGGSIWPIMFPGETELSILSPTGLAWSDISYYPAYWGV